MFEKEEEDEFRKVIEKDVGSTFNHQLEFYLSRLG
jgi:hypothetical protein